MSGEGGAGGGNQPWELEEQRAHSSAHLKTKLLSPLLKKFFCFFPKPQSKFKALKKLSPLKLVIPYNKIVDKAQETAD